MGASLWELSVLTRSSHPHLAQAASSLLTMKPESQAQAATLSGPLALAGTAKDLALAYDGSRGSFNPAPHAPKATKLSASQTRRLQQASKKDASHEMTEAMLEGAVPERAAFAEGPFLDAMLFRCVLFAFGFIAALFSYGWQSLFMMLCGVYAFKAGFFGPEGAAFRRRIALPALLLGLALSFGSALPSLILGFDSTAARVTYLVLVSLSAMVLPFAYAAIIVEWAPKLPSFLATPLERTGRMSFTVYLCESLVCTALASWWGLAWFGTLNDAQAAVTAFVVWLALVLFATAWLAIFRIGPFEWLWRMVTYVGNTGASKPIPA